jgi:hypothetical protein
MSDVDLRIEQLKATVNLILGCLVDALSRADPDLRYRFIDRLEQARHELQLLQGDSLDAQEMIEHLQDLLRHSI